MAKVLKLDCVSNSGDVEADLGSAPYAGPYAEVWVEVDVAFNATFLTALASSPNEEELIQIYASDGSTFWEEFLLNPAFHWDTVGRAGATSGGAPAGGPYTPPSLVAMQFYRLKMRLLAGTPATTQVWVDGVSLGAITMTGIDMTSIRYIDLQAVGLAQAGAFVYFDNFQAGTTDGGTDIFTDDFEGTLSKWNSFVSSDSTIVTDPGIAPPAPAPAPPVPAAAWTFKLYNIADDSLLCDLTNAATANLSFRLNRPLTATYTIAGDNTCCNTVNGDGDLNLCVGTRTIKAYQDGTLVANTPIENIEWDGDENTATAVVTCYDPLLRLLTRIVYDADGSFVKPEFADPISGGDLIKQMVDNSVTYDDAVFDAVTPAVFPLATTGTFDTTIPPAINLAFDVPDGPSTVAEIVTLLTDTGVVDVVVAPTDTSHGSAAGIVGKLSAVNKTGTDKTATVHFDYFTGDKNVAKCRRVNDMGTVGNRIIYELGPRRDPQHWKGNITATETTPVNLEEFLDAEMTSRNKYGTRTSISVYDSNGDENSARPLFHQLWETEVTLRVHPRQLLYLTPIAQSPFRPLIDFTLGDLVEVNVGAGLVGPAAAAEAQRIFGFDITIAAEGLEQLGELITSADAE